MKVLELIPCLLLDIVYSLYNSTVKPLSLSGQLKLYRSRWSQSFNRVNRYYFSKVSDTEILTILMDELEDYLSNDLELLRINVMNLLPSTSLSNQKILSDIYICAVLSSAAAHCWKLLYKKPNSDIESVSSWSSHLCDLYMHSIHYNERIDPNNSPNVVCFVRKIISKSVSWAESKGTVVLE